MAVTLTSPVEGKQPGEPYSGEREDYLLAEGYARRDGYDGPGVANTGPASIDPKDHPQPPQNREAPEETVVAVTSNLPAGGTNDGVVVGKAADQAVIANASEEEDVDLEGTPNADASDVEPDESDANEGEQADAPAPNDAEQPKPKAPRKRSS